jgi:hypothetical protein
VLWQDVYKLVERIYSKIDDLIANFPTEERTTASKLRNSANDSLFISRKQLAVLLQKRVSTT